MSGRELWIIILVVSVIAAIYVAEIFLVSDLVIQKYLRHIQVQKFFSRPAVVVHTLALAGLLCFTYAYFIEPYRIEVNTMELKTHKLHGDDIRLVQISDLHCDYKKRTEDKVVEIVNNLEPDVIIFTGDCLNTTEAIGLFKNTMNRLKATSGKLAVTGNWDMFTGADYFFSGTGFDVLDGENRRLKVNGNKICFTGLGWKTDCEIEPIVKQLPADCFGVFLYHSPAYIERLKTGGQDLYLCGHTHGGQVNLPFYGAMVTMSKFGKKYEAGLYKVAETLLYVNRGIGMDGGIAPRVRFLSRPEIAVFDIVPAGE